MPRMYDVLRRDGCLSHKDDEKVAPLTANVMGGRVPVYEVTNVWQYVMATRGANPAATDPFREFPTVVPPRGGVSWWEWKVRPEDAMSPGSAPEAVGVAVEVMDAFAEDEGGRLPDAIREPYLERVGEAREHARLAGGDPDAACAEVAFDFASKYQDQSWVRDLLRVLHDPLRWIVYTSVHVLVRGKAYGPYGVFVFPVTPAGTLARRVPGYDYFPQEPLSSAEAKRGVGLNRLPLPFICSGVGTRQGMEGFGVPPRPQPGAEIVVAEGGTLDLDYGGLEKDGLVVRPEHIHGASRRSVWPGDAEYDDLLKRGLERYEAQASAAVDALLGWGLYPFLQAVAFTHLRNAETVAVEPPPKLSRRYQKRHGHPLARYHVIEIKALKDAMQRRNRGPVTEGAPLALHIRSGGFSHYGNCCPGVHAPKGLLFGKHEGRVFVPDHLRGRAKDGVVVADYAVEPPEEGT